MNKLYEKIKGLEEWRVKRKIRKKMIENYTQNYQVETILEQWIIKRILDGAVERRKELAEKQARIKEMGAFISYLKKLK